MTRKFVVFVCTLLLLNTVSISKISAATLPQVVVRPAITTQPTNVTVKRSATATLTVVASGTAPLSYQWYKWGSPISGATASKYTTPATTDSDNDANFYVNVTNSAGSTSSNYAYLIVIDPPVIYNQPSSVTVTEPGVATFYVYAEGWPLTCQWYKNGVAISRATDCWSYTAAETTLADNGAKFTAVLKNFAGSVTTTAATLTVKASTITGTYPIVGNWSGTATITASDKSISTSPVVAAFSQTSYSITGVVVFTDDNGIPAYGSGVASLNGLNIYNVTDNGDGNSIAIAAGFSANLLTLNGVAGGSDGSGGSGTLTLSADHTTLTGSAKDSAGDTILWKLTREK